MSEVPALKEWGKMKEALKAEEGKDEVKDAPSPCPRAGQDLFWPQAGVRQKRAREEDEEGWSRMTWEKDEDEEEERASKKGRRGYFPIEKATLKRKKGEEEEGEEEEDEEGEEKKKAGNPSKRPRPLDQFETEAQVARKVATWLRKLNPEIRPKTERALRNSTVAWHKVLTSMPVAEVIPALEQDGIIAITRNDKGEKTVRVLVRLPVEAVPHPPTSGSPRLDVLYRASAWVCRNAGLANRAIRYDSFERLLADVCRVAVVADFDKVLKLLQDWQVLKLERGKLVYIKLEF